MLGGDRGYGLEVCCVQWFAQWNWAILVPSNSSYQYYQLLSSTKCKRLSARVTFESRIVETLGLLAVMETGLYSRCVEVRNIDKTIVFAKMPPSLAGVPYSYSGASCHKMRCGTKATGVLMTFHGLEFECPSGQEQMLSELPLDPPVETGSIMCPLWEDICSTSVDTAVGSLTCGELNQCSNRGRCYKGACYCFIGFTGMLWNVIHTILACMQYRHLENMGNCTEIWDDHHLQTDKNAHLVCQ